MLIAMAGPAMNLILAVVLVAFARVAVMFGSDAITELFLQMAGLSLMLCFFNLIPIPPLDGSHVMRNLSGMSYETYMNLCRFGFIVIIIVMQHSVRPRTSRLCHLRHDFGTDVLLGFPPE